MNALYCTGEAAEDLAKEHQADEALKKIIFFKRRQSKAQASKDYQPGPGEHNPLEEKSGLADFLEQQAHGDEDDDEEPLDDAGMYHTIS